MSRREWCAVLAATAVLTLLWTAPWLPHLGSRIPDPAPGHDINAADARIVVWAMAWQAHALTTDPSAFFDANVFHPARGMLTGSDTFVTPALLAAPVYLATNNAILGANLLTIATYGLCFLLMYVAVRSMGVGVAGSAVAGIAVALGPFRLPADVHTLQYSSALLVLVLLACLRADTRRNAFLAGVAILLGLFASFYSAAMVLVIVGVEVIVSAVRGDRAKAGRLMAAAVPGIVLLGLLALPWLARSGETSTVPTDLLASFEVVGRLFQPYYLNPANRIVGVGWAVAVLSLVGLLAPFVRRETPSLHWWRFTLILTAGALLAVGPSIQIGDIRIPMPYAVLIETPVRALRAFPRFIILAHVGLAGLAALGAETTLRACAAKLGERRATAVAAVLVLATLIPRSIGIAQTTFERMPVGDVSRDFYTRLAEGTPGPLLEIPAPWSAAAIQRKVLQSQFMIESTRHWRPLLNGHTGYPPWWAEWIRQEIYLIPEDASALQATVDATGLRWILVHRAHAGHVEWERWKAAKDQPGLETVMESKDHLLFEVRADPSRPWETRLRAGATNEAETILGTSRAPLPTSETRGRLSLVEAAQEVPAGGTLAVHLLAHNEGDATWPALAPKHGADDGLVLAESVWIPASGGAPKTPTTARLMRDVFPGETQHNWLDVAAPPVPGDYVLRLSLRQAGVAPLGDVPALEIPVRVTDPEAAPTPPRAFEVP